MIVTVTLFRNKKYIDRYILNFILQTLDVAGSTIFF